MRNPLSAVGLISLALFLAAGCGPREETSGKLDLTAERPLGQHVLRYNISNNGQKLATLTVNIERKPLSLPGQRLDEGWTLDWKSNCRDGKLVRVANDQVYDFHPNGNGQRFAVPLAYFLDGKRYNISLMGIERTKGELTVEAWFGDPGKFKGTWETHSFRLDLQTVNRVISHNAELTLDDLSKAGKTIEWDPPQKKQAGTPDSP